MPVPATPPFDAIAAGYDSEFTQTATGALQRALVHRRAAPWLPATGNVLELNCGTGEDALWLAQKGLYVRATDISPQMVQVTTAKIQAHNLETWVRCHTANAAQLRRDLGPDPGSFSIVFSNFGGLNCLSPEEIRHLATDLYALLPAGARLMVVVMGRFCWWETLYFLAKGQFRNAFRRRSKSAIPARLSATVSVDTWYYSPSEMRDLFAPFHLRRTEAIGCWLPPSYLEPLMQRMPRLLPILNRLENACRGRFFARLADHYMLILERF